MLRLLSAVLVATLSVANVDPSYLNALHWRMIGPFRGGRALAVAGVPGQPLHFYFGSVDGGVWESFNAGRTWTPIFDGQPIASIGAIAVAPSDPKIIYVGSGEADMRSDIAYGNGIYTSGDGGKTWRHGGLDDTRQIGRIVVDPHDANVAYVAALGHQYGPNVERGVFKTTDGGITWSKVLYKNADTGAIDLALDPSDSNTIYASLWQTRRPPWNVYPPSNGPGSGLYKSTDAGKTWMQLTGGLPAAVGRIGITISSAAPRRIYATVDGDAAHGGIYRSDDAGATWSRTDGEARVWQRGWYFGGITADPRNPDIVYVMDTAVYRSNDGGKTFDAILGDPTGDDFHTLWIDASDSSRMILGSDQGAAVSLDGAKTWSSWYNQPTGQFYHVSADDAFPYRVYGAQQDSGSAVVPSAGRYGTISQQDFRPLVVGGESGYIVADPRSAGVLYGATITKERPATGWAQNVDPTLDAPETLWRGAWTLPLAFSPADRRSLYFGRQKIFRSRDGGQTWRIISPDLSRAQDGTPPNLDGPTLADNNGLRRHGVVYAIAPSPLRANEIWAGTDDGLVWITRDDGKSWHNVTPPALSPWSKVGVIEASHFDPSAAYVAVDRHRLDDYAPYIYRTRDAGKTWTAIADGIPAGSFVNVVREDPGAKGLLYAGTERGVYVSFDDGARWQTLQLNLPVTSIRDLIVHGNDVVIATHGRSMWVLDDVATLRQLRSLEPVKPARLFAPALAYRVRPSFQEGTTLPLDEPQAENPTPGVNIDYYLSETAGRLTIDVLDEHGRTIRHWDSAVEPQRIDPKTVDYAPNWIGVETAPPATAGAHRFVWDFHEGNGNGPLVPPGRYTVRLTVGTQVDAQTATVLRDPRAPATDADLRAQYELARRIEDMHAHVAAARQRAMDVGKKDLAGEPAAYSPDGSVKTPTPSPSTFLYVENALTALEAAVESADAAPTADMDGAYVKLTAMFRHTLVKLGATQ